MKKFINILLLLITIIASACNKSNNSNPKSLDNYNVLLIIVDTLGAKYTSIYDNELDTTPNLKKLASQSVVFENAYSSSSWTKPSLASAFTSLYPSQHKANKLYVALDQSFETLAERMKERGYKTVGYVSHTMLSKTNGFTQGFDSWYQLLERFGSWFPIDWWEVKKELDKKEYGSVLIMRPGDKLNEYGYYFTILKKPRE